MKHPVSNISCETGVALMDFETGSLECLGKWKCGNKNKKLYNGACLD